MKQTICTYCPILLIAILLHCLMSCRSGSNSEAESLLKYVDTRVGTAPSITHTAGKFGKKTEEYGQTLPAVLEPNGMNFWTPQTRDTELKCVAPYYYTDTLLQGFRNSHWIVGGCTQDYGSMTLMPLFDNLRCQPLQRATRFSHQDEVATPSYYSVFLPDENIHTEMTARSRSAIYRFTYKKAGKGYLVVNPNSDEGQGYISIDTINNQIYGYNPVHRIYQGLGKPAGYSGHFVIQFNKKITNYGTYRGDSLFTHATQIDKAPRMGLFIEFDVEPGEEVLIKAASSFVSREGAIRNLEAEIPHWDFDRTRTELSRIWELHFSSIKVETENHTDKEKFYGAFYRASFLPRTFNDVDGHYPSFAKGEPIRQLPEGETYYEDFSMWDTYRALHPLINLIYPTKGGDMMQSLVHKYEQGGWLPAFPCWNSYTAAMIGDHSIAAIGDAYSKGIRNFDVEKAYEGMRKNAFEIPSDIDEYKDGMGRRALTSYLKYGYIPLEDAVPDAFHTQEQVSRTMEYAYDDFVLAQMAKSLGKTADYEKLILRATNYRNVIDPRTGYAQGRHADGTFLDENNAFSFVRFITEGAPCHYTWYAPQDPYGLMESMGGKANYIAKLDSMFSEQRYWHGNEPCHQVAFMFNYAGEPWKTQQAVRHIMETEYLNTPGGLAGNDDAGQMSAWYMFAAMGFYPVCPGTPYYMLASPSFPSLTLHLENKKTFTVKALKASEKNIYIQSATLNGKPYTRNYITHQDIMNGGTMEFVMGDKPNTGWGTRPEDCPPDMIM
ncbi:GH92 family glycosyl hydrolase [Dysgonomonas macrotermitis]|uniref:Alpha-1,2-mannosidase, putative n=1 Tax=Dysgonomonas macrotermitis TaxID=1346286 RepID=A0A1M4X5V8_9BACT|nr:GH92 family glycosyl hydrolase [Dysgonomonas macrotermitis]SHE88870.1 alpha-1,2-mannosidase, putative [Dysgonomonas macrotermitis]